MRAAEPLPMRFGPAEPLRGEARLPGDKSISHRALILAALAVGESRIHGLNEGRDVLATMAALEAMGARFRWAEDESWRVRGVGVGGLLQPQAALDLGNSGTSARLLAGLIATHPITATLTGDSSLSRRPMDRVAGPLRRLGAEITGERLPMTIRGLAPVAPAEHRLELPSAQAKSALLLAGLDTPGTTRLIEPVPTRDHLERMLPLFGAELAVAGEEIRLHGEPELRPAEIEVPGDPSAAAFLTAAALIVPGSELRIPDICVNPRRIGFFHVLEAMGADLRFENERQRSGEPVADLVVRHGPLKRVNVPPELAPSMIDEFPIFFVAAAFAEGTSRAEGLAELRVKESDRLRAIAVGLAAIGARVEQQGDVLVVQGSGGRPLAGGAAIASKLDHRIAMSFAVAGLGCREPIGIDDTNTVETSFPGFAELLERLAAREDKR